ncbi:hypothetical protein Poli38472_011349 [Pythium oligandrum]|uniref:F5/8 type C domain-containing protein n=1 Tax=Pythium oligandrum TaxID=41045 RepID=A0A8K1FKR4_PYTOL|nr:hypothetical protein Poli38472_011349 [Pythium oligandrum]|eukprot:TMW64469.1 hypothetical protein Poli38472_011349 [Pythium oligandrum]
MHEQTHPWSLTYCVLGLIAASMAVSLLIAVAVFFAWSTRLVIASVNFPGVEYNAATGQRADASSYYNYKPNAIYDTVYVPQNAIDGFMDESSWWSGGDETNEVYWQLNLTEPPPRLVRFVVRWHGFLTPATYQIRVAYSDQISKFQTIVAVGNKSIEYDRVDTISQGLEKVDPRFQILRIVMDTANICQDAFTCTGNATTSTSATNERIVYGIREFELWATGAKSDACKRSLKLWWVYLALVSWWLET